MKLLWWNTNDSDAILAVFSRGLGGEGPIGYRLYLLMLVAKGLTIRRTDCIQHYLLRLFVIPKFLRAGVCERGRFPKRRRIVLGGVCGRGLNVSSIDSVRVLFCEDSLKWLGCRGMLCSLFGVGPLRYCVGL